MFHSKLSLLILVLLLCCKMDTFSRPSTFLSQTNPLGTSHGISDGMWAVFLFFHYDWSFPCKLYSQRLRSHWFPYRLDESWRGGLVLYTSVSFAPAPASSQRLFITSGLLTTHENCSLICHSFSLYICWRGWYRISWRSPSKRQADNKSILQVHTSLVSLKSSQSYSRTNLRWQPLRQLLVLFLFWMCFVWYRPCCARKCLTKPNLAVSSLCLAQESHCLFEVEHLYMRRHFHLNLRPLSQFTLHSWQN